MEKPRDAAVTASVRKITGESSCRLRSVREDAADESKACPPHSRICPGIVHPNRAVHADLEIGKDVGEEEEVARRACDDGRVQGGRESAFCFR